MTLEADYTSRLAAYLEPVAQSLERHLLDQIGTLPGVDRISVRAKSTESFLKKASKLEPGGNPKYVEPLRQIQDQLGARVITRYVYQVDSVAAEIERYFRPVEIKQFVPDGENEFGYEGRHFVLFLPTEVIPPPGPSPGGPSFFELQIKTLFQHAWAEANHDLAYKAPIALTQLQKRKFAFLAAQAWGADLLFQELARELDSASEGSSN